MIALVRDLLKTGVPRSPFPGVSSVRRGFLFSLTALFLLVLLYGAPSVVRGDSATTTWSEADTRRQVVYTALHVIDWGQTLHTAESDDYYERNPVLGENPSRGEVNTYFALTGLAHYAVSRALPPRYRRVWQYVTITNQAVAVGNNFRIGVKIRF